MSTSKKMEDDLEKNIKKNGRRPKINIKKNGRRPKKK